MLALAFAGGVLFCASTVRQPSLVEQRGRDEGCRGRQCHKGRSRAVGGGGGGFRAGAGGGHFAGGWPLWRRRRATGRWRSLWRVAVVMPAGATAMVAVMPAAMAMADAIWFFNYRSSRRRRRLRQHLLQLLSVRLLSLSGVRQLLTGQTIASAALSGLQIKTPGSLPGGPFWRPQQPGIVAADRRAPCAPAGQHDGRACLEASFRVRRGSEAP